MVPWRDLIWLGTRPIKDVLRLLRWLARREDEPASDDPTHAHQLLRESDPAIESRNIAISLEVDVLSGESRADPGDHRRPNAPAATAG